DFGKNTADISNANLEALYVAMEGVNLKPDFQVLDPLWAPFTVNGYSWGEVPSSKVPEKCKTIITQAGLLKGSTCKNIVSGLEPKKPTQTEMGFNYTGDCSQCMNDHDQFNCPPGVLPPQPYPVSPSKNPFTKVLMEQKTKFYYFCLDKKITIANRCTECTKKADEECNQIDKIQKEECIKQRCDNFQDIIPLVNALIIDGKDFYNKCLIEEKNSACLTCLREYFIPATYCEQIDDYMARSIVKYPTPLKAKREGDGRFIGPYDPYYDEINGGDNECNNDEGKNVPIDLSLICRIMPDFSYDNQFVCKTKCNKDGMTTEELENTTDFRPNSLDCGGATLPIGGRLNVWEVLHQGQLATKGKCCAAVWPHDKEKYTMCVGGAPLAAEEEIEGWCDDKGRPLYKNPECFCEKGWRPIDLTKNTTTGSDFYSPWYNVGRDEPEETCSRALGGVNILVPNMAKANKAILETNSAAGGSIVYVAEHEAIDPDLNSCLYEKVCAGTNLPLCENRTMTTSCDFVANPPAGIICSEETVHTPSAYNCCNSGGVGSGKGVIKVECDLGGYKNKTVFLGVYNNDETDCRTVVHMCIECDPSDPGYDGGSYGFRDKLGNPIDQCDWKVGI
ncbi:MAG: hypothetical protein ABIH48_02970, partial [Candidatus Falkowbacteria bacterium]